MIDINLLKAYDVVSFDIFDTLVRRLVEKPTDVFWLIEKKDDKYRGFYKARIDAEKKARKESIHEEVSLNEIYYYLEKDGFDRTDELKQVEIDMELKCCVPNCEMVKLYYDLLNLNKRIILISDMYFDEIILSKILSKCGINGYEKLYVSSAVGFTKESGSIYKCIQNELGVNIKRWIHIGDNYISDYKRPQRNGIVSYHYKNEYMYKLKKKRGDSIKDRVIYGQVSLCNNAMKMEDYQIGYSLYGPMLYGFSTWILESIRDKKIKNVLFVSRDGYIIKQLFDILGYDEYVNSRYFLASRRSLWLASFKGKVEIGEFYRRAISEFPEEFKLNLIIDEFNLKDVWRKNCPDIELEYVVKRNRALEDEKFLKMFSAIEHDLNEVSMNEYKAFVKYFQSLKIDSSEKIGFVDIGWRGTMQMMLESMLDKEIYGYYWGIDNSRYKLKNVSSYVPSWFNMEFKPVPFLELFFSAPHGSINKYNLKSNGRVEIVYKKNEHHDDTKVILDRMRLGALDFCKDFNNNPHSKKEKWYPLELMNGLLYQLKYPSKQDVLFYQQIKFYDVKMSSLIQSNNKLYYVKHPASFLSDLKKSLWKTGFLKKVFEFNLPYYKFLILARRAKRLLRIWR